MSQKSSQTLATIQPFRNRGEYLEALRRALLNGYDRRLDETELKEVALNVDNFLSVFL